MAIDLTKLEKPAGQRPIIVTLFGEGGMGKTTLASMFPSPVFIRTEDGTASLQGADHVSLMPLAHSVQDVFDQIEALATQDHEFRTLVIDSVTQLATMIEHEIVAGDPKAKSIAQAGGGYGAGYSAAAERHRQIREWAGSLAYDKGMNIVFIAHADTEVLDLPDYDPFARYCIRMHRKSVPHYTDNVDAVCLIRLKTHVVGDEDKRRAISSGEREIICHPQASSVTKNRFAISKPLSFSFDSGNPFQEWCSK